MRKFFAVVKRKRKGDFVIAKAKNDKLLVYRTKADSVGEEEYEVDSFFLWTEVWDFSVGLKSFSKLTPTKKQKLIEIFRKSYLVVRDYRGNLIPLGAYFEKLLKDKKKKEKEEQEAKRKKLF